MFDLDKVFSRKREQKRVAEFLLKNALRVSPEARVYSKNVEVPYSSVAKEVGVDRRVVKSTVDMIAEDPELNGIYSKLDHVLLLRDVAPDLGYGAIEIIPTDAGHKGIVASIAKIIVDSGISIRQIISEDPMFEGAQTTVITERPLPRELIDRILETQGVKKVIVIN